MLSAYRQTGRLPEELSFKPLPDNLVYLWAWFKELDNRREYGEHGPKLISWEALQAWQNLRRNVLEPWELEVVMLLDAAFCNIWYEARK